MAVLNAKMDIRMFFGVSYEEFDEFWESLSDDERYYYRTVDLKTGRPKVLRVFDSFTINFDR